ncbi:MAG: PPC domain-containing protein, partial [Myxococcota bacterium]|nr:PPC domain-containing protein [Myxococcota bacterium]
MQRHGPSQATPARGTVFAARARAGGLCAALNAVLSCAASGGAAALEPRFLAVHNALTAIGLAQVGPLHQGVLAERHEERVPLELAPGCTTIVAVGGDGIRDLDATLLDREGQRQAHDTTIEPQAVLRACVDAAGTYVLVIRAAAGGGAWVAGTWQGGGGDVGRSFGGTLTTAARERNGTCRAPIPITQGTFTGSTTHGDHENTGSCGPSDSRELVYELDVPERQRVTIEVEARFDSVLYVRKDDCTDASAEVDCSDDSPDRTHSKIERVLEPGKYYVFVDGYGQDEGPFKMTVAASDVLALADVCRGAPLL